MTENETSYGTALATQQRALAHVGETLPTSDLVRRAASVQSAMKNVMKEGIHFGKVPGTNSKSLLKPGAEALGGLFQFRPVFEVDERELPDLHREYRVVCALWHYPTETLVATGRGSCSTMESKYRWRWAEIKDPHGRPVKVPDEYWQSGQDPEVIWACSPSGAYDMNLFARKDFRGNWKVARRLPNPNVPDLWNTVEKMACKRAHVAAVILATGCSDMFSQDLEDLHANLVALEGESATFEDLRRDTSRTGNGGPPSPPEPEKPEPNQMVRRQRNRKVKLSDGSHEKTHGLNADTLEKLRAAVTGNRNGSTIVNQYYEELSLANRDLTFLAEPEGKELLKRLGGDPAGKPVPPPAKEAELEEEGGPQPSPWDNPEYTGEEGDGRPTTVAPGGERGAPNSEERRAFFTGSLSNPQVGLPEGAVRGENAKFGMTCPNNGEVVDISQKCVPCIMAEGCPAWDLREPETAQESTSE